AGGGRSRRVARGSDSRRGLDAAEGSGRTRRAVFARHILPSRGGSGGYVCRVTAGHRSSAAARRGGTVAPRDSAPPAGHHRGRSVDCGGAVSGALLRTRDRPTGERGESRAVAFV